MVSVLAWAGVLAALAMALGGAVRDWWLAERSSRRELELDGWLRKMRRQALAAREEQATQGSQRD